MKVKKTKKFGFSGFLILLIFLAGVGVLLYPACSNLLNRHNNRKLIISYGNTVGTMQNDKYQEIWDAAVAYNRTHTENRIVDAFSEEGEGSSEYEQLLNPAGSGIMGYLEIPSINVGLAVYHGVGEEVLQSACGHIEGTSLPVGGESSHAVLSAHRGLPEARLFTDLDQMKEGDLFTVTVLEKKLTYEVDQILTVLPDELDALAIEEGKDYMTLVTCTPYGVNTHRLLVRGHRIEEADVPEMQNPEEGARMIEGIWMIPAGMILLVMLFMLLRKRKKK